MKFKLWISLLVILGVLLVPIQFADAVALVRPAINYLNDLLDVNVPAPTNNYIIYWNNSSGYWEARAEDTFVCGDLASCSIDSLSDVNTAFETEYDFLVWSNYSSAWENELLSSVAIQIGANLGLHQLGNVNGSLLQGYILYWDVGDSEFKMKLENALFSCGDLASCNISELGNVNATAPNDNDILFWNNTASEWQTKAESGAAFNCTDLNACNISSLGNINVTSPADGWIIFWNETAKQWQARAESIFNCTDLDSCNISNLGNVNTSSLVANDILYWNSTAGEWRNKAESVFNCTALDSCNLTDLGNVNITSSVNNSFFYWNNATGEWQSRLLVAGDIPNLDAGKITTGILDPARVGPRIQDADNDTFVTCEKTADEDTIRMDVSGTESFILNSTGIFSVPQQSSARAYRNAAQTASNGGWTRIMYDTENWDTQNEYATASYTPTVNGTYLIIAQVQIENLDDQDFLTSAIYVDGAIVALDKLWVSGSGTGYATAITLMRLNKLQTIDGYCYLHHPAGNLPIKTGSSFTYIVIYKLG